MNVIRKITQSRTGTVDASGNLPLFTFTSRTIDAYDDLVVPEGVDCETFKKNPISLLQHSADAPIGVWERLHIKDGELRGYLRLAPEGTSQKADEARKLIECGILRGCSIGFIPLESEPRPGSTKGGVLYKRVRLVEASVVSIPANPSALLQAKALGVSTETIKMLFKQQNRQAATPTLSERIARSRRAVREAKAILARGGPPRLLTMSDETADLYARSRKATAKARALLAKGAADQIPQSPSWPEGTFRGHSTVVTWRGVPIVFPKGKFF